jgi:heat shock protein HtpX
MPPMPPAVDAPSRLDQNRRRAATLVNRCLLALAVPIGVLGLLVIVFTRAWLLVLAVLVVEAAVLATVANQLRGYGDRFLAASGARPADGDGFARLHNLVEGLSVAHGLPTPAIVVLDAEGANACAVVGRDRQPTLVVTRALVDGLERIELEGVLTHVLCRVRDGDAALGTLVAAVATGGVFSLIRPVLGDPGGALDPDMVALADFAAVALTRYPPGLAAGLERVDGVGTVVPLASPVDAHLWFASPLADGGVGLGTFPPLDERAAALREL